MHLLIKYSAVMSLFKRYIGCQLYVNKRVHILDVLVASYGHWDENFNTILLDIYLILSVDFNVSPLLLISN